MGSLKQVGLKAARDEVAKHRPMRAVGKDPKRAKAVETAAGRTFKDDAADYYQARHHGWSAGHAYNWRSQMDRYALPLLGKVATQDIKAADVVAAIAPIWGKLSIAPGILDNIAKTIDFAMTVSDDEEVNFPRGNVADRAKGRVAQGVQPAKRAHGSVDWRDAPALFRS